MRSAGHDLPLTANQRRAIRRGAWPKMYVDEPPLIGATGRAGDGLKVVVTGVKRERGKPGHRVLYRVQDDRPRLLKDSPYAGYTTDPSKALQNEGEAVPAEYETRLTEAANTADQLRRDQVIEAGVSNLDVESVLTRCNAAGIDTTSVEFIMRRQLAKLESRLAAVQ